LFHGAWADYRGGDTGVPDRECDGHLYERQGGFVGERGECVGGVELCRVGGVGGVKVSGVSDQ
jgi:hypothetical protein